LGAILDDYPITPNALVSHSTKAAMINALFERRPRYLLIDEIEHTPEN
jgi:hypothetical protein